MLLDISEFAAWQQHLQKRILQATNAGLLQVTATECSLDGSVFVPTQIGPSNVGSIDPQSPLRSLTSMSATEGGGWQARPDLFEEAGDWIKSSLRGIPDAFVICEAGYSAVGDRVLDSRDHLVHDGRPMLRANVDQGTANSLATVLRWGRSQRVLAVATTGSNNHLPIDFAKVCFFLCDAFAGDSLIISHLQAANRSDFVLDRIG